MFRKFIFLILIYAFVSMPFIAESAYAALDSAEYLCELGIAFYKQNRFDDALMEFKKALIINPANKVAKQYINNIFTKEISTTLMPQKAKTTAEQKTKYNFRPKSKGETLPKVEQPSRIPPKQEVGIKEQKPAPRQEKSAKEIIPSKPRMSRDEAMNSAFTQLSREKRRRAPEKKSGEEAESRIPATLSGEYRLALGMTPDHVIWKDANADEGGVPREKNWRYLWGQERYNSYDRKIYDRLTLDMNTDFNSPTNLFAQVIVDPWTFLGKNHVTLVSLDGTDVVDMDLKYWSNNSRIINETYRSRKGQILRLKEIKVEDGKSTPSGVTIAPNETTYNAIAPMDIDRTYLPIRKFWIDYKQDDYLFKIFPISDEYEALTTDDPLKISNNHVYWEESPWLDTYEPSVTFEPDNELRPIKRGKWVRRYSYIARDSSDDYPHRLTFLRGLSFKADTGSYSLEATLATPMNLWDEYYRADSVHEAIRLKVPVTDDLQVGFTTTSKVGLDGGSFEALNQVEGFDSTYQLSPDLKVYGQVAESHTEIEESEGFKTVYDGVATKLGLGYNTPKKEGDGLYKAEAYYAYVDGSFYPALTNYRYTRSDDVTLSKHIVFSGIKPEDEALIFGDGIDRNRTVLGFKVGHKSFEEKLDTDFKFRNVHSIGGKYIESVGRGEASYKITPKLTSKTLAYYKHLPKTDANFDPLLYSKTIYSLTDYFSDDDSHPKNTQVLGDKDPSIGSFGFGLKYDFIEQLSLEGIYERTNDPLDFPRSLFNDLAISTEIVDDHRWDRVEPFLYEQQIFGLPPYNYYNIVKGKLIYQPLEHLEVILSGTYNENRYTTGMDDNINHAGLELNYKLMDKWSFWAKYIYSIANDVYKQLKIGGSDFYEGHHNAFFATEYKIDDDSTFTLLYGEFVGYNNPYQQTYWSLSTLDTQHIVRLYYKRKF